MRIHIDTKKCEGHALCAEIAPSVFAVGDDDVSTVADPDPHEKTWPDIRNAAAACPTLAITLTDSGGEPAGQ